MPQIRNRLRRHAIGASAIVSPHAAHPAGGQEEPILVHLSLEGIPPILDSADLDNVLNGFALLIAAEIAGRLDAHVPPHA